jgi:hypothetical protein
MQARGRLAVVGLFALLAALVGCSSNSTSSTANLNGRWTYTTPDGSQTFGVALNGDGTYELKETVVGKAATPQVQLETGIYTATAAWITFTPLRSSCAASAVVTTAPYLLQTGSLELTSGPTVYTFHPDTSPAATTTGVQMGCFDTAGTFTPGTLADVHP